MEGIRVCSLGLRRGLRLLWLLVRGRGLLVGGGWVT